MTLNEAKLTLEDNGYILEMSSYSKYTLLDKHAVSDYDEDSDPYVVVYGPVSLARLKAFIDRNITKDFNDIPFNPKPEEEPEEGFIIVGG